MPRSENQRIRLLRTADALREREQRLSYIQRLAQLGDFQLDIGTGQVNCSEALREFAQLEQAELMQGYGANCLYVTDSAGYMLPDDVSARISALRDALANDTEVYLADTLGDKGDVFTGR